MTWHPMIASYNGNRIEKAYILKEYDPPAQSHSTFHLLLWTFGAQTSIPLIKDRLTFVVGIPFKMIYIFWIY